MNRLLICIPALLAALFSAIVIAEESKEEKEEAAFVDKMLTENKLDAIYGKLTLEPVEEGKDAPKVVGILTSKTESYKIQLIRKSQFKELFAFNNQNVTLRGHVVEKEGQGKTVYFEELEFAAPKAPGKTKRGGF